MTDTLINVARATIVDKTAFYRALKEKWIKGAAQDVWWIRQPLPSYLPPEDELWQLDNIFITSQQKTPTSKVGDECCILLKIVSSI